MAAAPVDMHATQMQMRTQDLQSRSRQLDALAAGGGKQADKDKKLREACEGFESIFIQKMWEQMRATVPKNGLLQGREEQFWQGMYDQELSKKMASAGGIGLADMMYDQLSRNLVSASRTTASTAGNTGSGFIASAAPLMPDTPGAAAPTTDATQTATTQAGGIYAGAAPQPQAGEEARQNGGTPVAQAETEAVNSSDSPVVQQFLAELRRRQAAAQQHPEAATVTTTQQVYGSGMTLAQQAQRTAATRMRARGG